MRVMTFNIQHCRNFIEDKIDFEIMANTILQCNPDIVGLNEVRGEGPHPDYTAQTEMLAELTNMPYYYFAPAIELPNGLYGNAFLSKIPIINAEIIAIPDPDEKRYTSHYETRCVLKLKLESDIVVLVTHFGLNPDEQANALITVLSNIVSEKCILMGDMNLTPKENIISLIKEKMKDTADKFEEPMLSFPSDIPTRKIDYIFVTPDIEVRYAEIPSIVASDHRPHIADLVIN